MIRCLFFLSLLIHATLAAKGGKKPNEAPSKNWLTLNGGEPVVIARGGFSGLLPESCQFANKMGLSTSLPNTILFCNLQMTKDAAGICLTDISLDNSTNVAEFFPKGKRTYKINGQDIKGWFALDYTMDQLFANVSLIQNVYSRPNLFDGFLPISTVEDVLGVKPPQFWINVQYPTFYDEHKISVQKYLEEGIKPGAINYISSPEIGFLKSINGMAGKGTKLKLVFAFQDADAVEPTSKKTYSEILKDLNTVKSFASGILVPKNYIWPVNNKTKYLEAAPTTLVTDAHKLGLEVYASGFANDMIGIYNYSYDPSLEYLQFIDNSQFAVDGFLTDFPPTASEAIACFALNNNTKPTKGQALIISNEGASGMYPGSTDLAYQQAINDGADIIDCWVQMSKDGVAFCMGSADLVGRTNAMTSFASRSSSVPEIQPNNGIFSFDLTWTEIQTLKPELFTEYEEKFPRNPAAKNKGKFVSLDGFLELAKSKGASGIILHIENVPYLASKKGLDVIDTVTKALKNATFDKQSTQQVLISSEDTSVLSKFADFKTYRRVWRFEEKVSSAPKKSIGEIKKHADAVLVPRYSVIDDENGFTKSYSSIVKEFQSANLSVYVSPLRNEYVSFAFDYFADPILQLASYVAGAGVDGLLTEYPATASRYMRSPCSDMKKNQNLPYAILPSEPGGLLGLAPEEAQPPASAPAPALSVADIADPPLPPVTTSPPSSTPPTDGAPSGTKPPPSTGMANVANIGLSMAAIMVFSLLFM